MRSRSRGRRRSVDRGRCGPGIQPRKKIPPGRRRCKEKRKAASNAPKSRGAFESCAVRDPEHVPKHLAREPGGPAFSQSGICPGAHREVRGRTPMMNERGKSDRPVVPVKSSNKIGQPAAEGMEGRGLTKGNPQQQNASRTPSRNGAPSALERIRQAASKDKEMRFTALLHHVYHAETLRAAYLSLKREAAPGVDGETWRHYGEALEDNLQDLSQRLKRGAYRAKPVRRVYIPKAHWRRCIMKAPSGCQACAPLHPVWGFHCACRGGFPKRDRLLPQDMARARFEWNVRQLRSNSVRSFRSDIFPPSQMSILCFKRVTESEETL